MKVVRCLNGHYYDSDKYSTCPHCGAEVTDNNQNGAMNVSNAPVQYGQPMNQNQYYYTEDPRHANQNDFKTPNMDLNNDAEKEYPPTVSYGHGDFVRDSVTGQVMTRQEYQSNNLQAQQNRQGMDNMSGLAGHNAQETWQNSDTDVAPTYTADTYVEQNGYQNGYQDVEFAAEAAPTATLNVPVMPSLRQNLFQQVPVNGFGKSEDDDYSETKTEDFSEKSFDETMVLSSGPQTAPEVQGAKAVLTQTSTYQKYFITKSETIIGKINQKIHNDISVSNNTVSRKHACIYIINDKFFIEDLESTNKTHINGIDIGSRRMIELKDNDNLVLSDEEFVFSLI
ncbi:MAG: FHA domain-containing protein [Eubacterium sp.]|nr:FHA domain-containing protein [Eubacterium sp.]